MSNAIAGLQPALVWKYFADISRIPRCSKHEERMTRYVLDTARTLGLKAKADASGNVAVKKPASKGRERLPSVALQGHLDMVCEKNKGIAHDFATDPITLVRRGSFLMADGTTLGADNGIAVATNLAIMEDTSLEHGPLEFLFTVDEETGLTGAHALEADFLDSRILLNLDSEEEGSLYVGCAGGRDTIGTWQAPLEPAAAGWKGAHLVVKGLKGGHSGLEIHQGRGNAIKLLNRALLALTELGARVGALHGGNKHNAIPREAEADIAVPAKAWEDAVRAVAAFGDVACAELGKVDPELRIVLEPVKGKVRLMPRALQKKVLATISALPHGVIKMSADIPGLTETSTNVAVLTTARGKITLATSQRSSVDSEIREICHTVASILALGGAEVHQGDGYPGWKPDMDSAILKTARKTYRALFGKDAEIKAIHAGLECGIIGERMPGMDMVSFGPTLEGVHSPDEKIHLDTVGRFWDFLLAILKNVQ